MYAVIESGGKQHRVKEGEILQLEKLEAATGDKVKFDKILMVGMTINHFVWPLAEMGLLTRITKLSLPQCAR